MNMILRHDARRPTNQTLYTVVHLPTPHNAKMAPWAPWWGFPGLPARTDAGTAPKDRLRLPELKQNKNFTPVDMKRGWHPGLPCNLETRVTPKDHQLTIPRGAPEAIWGVP